MVEIKPEVKKEMNVKLIINCKAKLSLCAPQAYLKWNLLMATARWRGCAPH